MANRPRFLHPERHANERACSGFTLAETMLALIILVILAGIVTMGLPAAFNAYKNAVTGSNAQVLLSTAASELRDEFGLAQDVGEKGGVLYYVTGDGYWASIDKTGSADDGSARIVKHVYTGSFDDVPGTELDEPQSPMALMTEAAMTDGLGVTYDAISYDEGVVTIAGLKVVDSKGSTLASTGSEAGNALLIRASFAKEG